MATISRKAPSRVTGPPDGPKVGLSLAKLAMMVPAGGVRLNISDFAKFAAAEADVQAGRPIAGLSEKALANAAILRPADAPANPPSGMTTFGGDGLFNAGFATWPKQRTAIAVACNLGDADEHCEAAIRAIQAAMAPDLRADGAPRGPEGPRYGFSLRVEADGPLVIGPVAAGSIAELAGLKEGDKVIAINGTDLEKIAEDDRMPLIRANTLKLTLERDGKRFDVEMKK